MKTAFAQPARALARDNLPVWSEAFVIGDLTTWCRSKAGLDEEHLDPNQTDCPGSYRLAEARRIRARVRIEYCGDDPHHLAARIGRRHNAAFDVDQPVADQWLQQ